ncbi:hypothetical protein [Aliiruegeria sabulilitoris]|uniref:hypothetical protein n=1 Tax=Aliiruegeria sabulilitoris TaxID=1510458 RepID=UPI0013D60F99|nr:hypothetical protein [Aliiruegeria sabulilitoris]
MITQVFLRQAVAGLDFFASNVFMPLCLPEILRNERHPMRRVYSNVHIGLISALLLAAIAFEAGAAHGEQPATEAIQVSFASEIR